MIPRVSSNPNNSMILTCMSEGSCCFQHMLVVHAGFASLLPQATQFCPLWVLLLLYFSFSLTQLIAECLEHFPGLGLGSTRRLQLSGITLLLLLVSFHLLSQLVVSYKPARFACTIVLLSRWMFNSGYLVLIWFCCCFVCTQGKRFCIKILLECWVTWTLLMCHVLDCLSTEPGYVMSCKMCFLFSPLELCWNGFQITHLLKAGKVLSHDVIPLLKVCFDLFQEPGWDLIPKILFACFALSICCWAFRIFYSSWFDQPSNSKAQTVLLPLRLYPCYCVLREVPLIQQNLGHTLKDTGKCCWFH